MGGGTQCDPSLGFLTAVLYRQSFEADFILLLPYFYIEHVTGKTLIATYNHFHNILILFYVLPKFSFTTSTTVHNYYL